MSLSRVHLTLLDLPGIIRARGPNDPEDIHKTCERMVRGTATLSRNNAAARARLVADIRSVQHVRGDGEQACRLGEPARPLGLVIASSEGYTLASQSRRSKSTTLLSSRATNSGRTRAKVVPASPHDHAGPLGNKKHRRTRAAAVKNQNSTFIIFHFCEFPRAQRQTRPRLILLAPFLTVIVGGRATITGQQGLLSELARWLFELGESRKRSRPPLDLGPQRWWGERAYRHDTHGRRLGRRVRAPGRAGIGSRRSCFRHDV